MSLPPGLIFVAATPFHWAGKTYSTNDRIDTTGWNTNAVQEFMHHCPVYLETASGSGGTGGPETDPVASAALVTHKASADHDARYTAAAHVGAADPHADRAHSDTALTGHIAAVDPHGDRVHSDTALAGHTGAADPHGSQAYTDSRITALVNAAPTALDTLAEIDAQLASDETGAAAMQAAINARALAADLTTETTRAQGAETTNANNLTGHINAAAAAHAASAVSVNPAGLVVVSGTNVQAALAQLDTWANGRPTSESGTLAAMPANGSRPNGSTYFATDQFGGTTYRMVAGAWVQQSAGVSQASGQIIAGPVNLTSQFNVYAVNNVQTDIPGMSLNVPASTRPVLLRFKGEGALNPGTAPTGTVMFVWVILTDGANTFKAMSEVTRASVGVSANQTVDYVVEYYLPAPVAAATYKLRAQMGQANAAGFIAATIQPTGGVTAGVNSFYAVTM